MNFQITGTYTDLYQLAMGQAYYRDGSHKMPATFDYFFRKLPFHNGYVVFAGLADVLDMLESLRFTSEDIDYLGKQGFNADYLEMLRNFRFRGTIHAPREGDVIFPAAPVLRVEGTMLEVQLVETLILNTLNFQSLIATKAARIRMVAGDSVLSDFGLRRAQGFGAITASRAAVIGGFDSTSNVYAAEKYGLKAEGTMAHSFIQLYGDELQAFRKFAEARPKNSVFLVDTYNTLQSGVPNAIKVAKEMEERGERLKAIRLDSGDLSFLAQRARAMLDKAGLEYVKIAASNQLDEFVVRSLRQQNAPIDIFGVGTNLITGHPDGALDGVYKLVEADGKPRIKVSENIQKVTLPGNKQVHRLLNEDGSFFGVDALSLSAEGVPTHIINPHEAHKTMQCAGINSEPLLKLVMKNGEAINRIDSIAEIKNYASQRLSMLPPEYKRFENPHVYKVGISEGIKAMRDELLKKHAF
ncbi:nicotinate phosphoribosyltransferase [Cryomorpha ignava]|uniref:Nicotinate phosphoribosyltransferase n=1 Tax=Cryomorpha ignava TaxID=101383 RepID=A0A7K3WKJ4_9FLAO|nr:nicotinate phosphoribosyltransferase [Cryomorpha ignava]NEN22170.1 nicotinate phosphoribosyltransferase [Cryomorpha ignava]